MAVEYPEHRLTRLQALSDALYSGRLRSVQRMINALHPAEIASLLESLPADERAAVWELVIPDDEGDVLLEDDRPDRDPPVCRRQSRLDEN
mgnify:CR=1 FL=1